MLNLHSTKLQRTTPKERQKVKKLKGASFSRTLALKPQEALSGLKVRVAKLQEEYNNYYSLSKPTCSSDWDSNPQSLYYKDTVFPKTQNLLPPPSAIKTGPSFFAPRSLNKATIQRLKSHMVPFNKGGLIPMQPGRLDLSIYSTKSNLPKPMNHSSLTLIPPRPSIHIPVLPIQDRAFSEELSTIPPDSCTDRPDSRSALHSGTDALSHMSSDRMIISADLATHGELVLLNREGEVVHQVVGSPGTDIGGLESTGIEVEESPSPETELMAPPPTARKEEVVVHMEFSKPNGIENNVESP